MTELNGLGGIAAQVAADVLNRQAAIETSPKQAASPKSWSNRKPPDSCADFVYDLVSKQVQQAFRDAYKESRWPCYLFGPTGRGKTYTAAWIYQAWPGHEFDALWFPVSPLLRFFAVCRKNGAAVWNSHETTELGMMQRIGNVKLAVFDDIGVRNPTDSAYEILLNIIEKRKDKPTIYTSNIAPDALGKVYDERLSSRLLSGTWIQFSGKDRRLEKPKVIRISE